MKKLILKWLGISEFDSRIIDDIETVSENVEEIDRRIRQLNSRIEFVERQVGREIQISRSLEAYLGLGVKKEYVDDECYPKPERPQIEKWSVSKLKKSGRIKELKKDE